MKGSAYDILREKLINCEYRPGSMLNESQLSEELGFSRTPIREALSRISHEGFVRIIPKKGIYVTNISLGDVMQIFQVRLEIEPIALRMAGLNLPESELLNFRDLFSGEEPDVRVGFRLDTAMHLFIIENCGNHFIIEMMHKVFDENTRVIISSKQNQVKIHDARMEHLKVINYLLEKDIDRAQQAMREHVECCRKAAFDFFYSMQAFTSQPVTNYKIELKKSDCSV